MLIEERRIKYLRCDGALLGSMLINFNNVEMVSKLPPDVKCVGVRAIVEHPQYFNQVAVYFESESFGIIREGMLIPELPHDMLMCRVKQ